MRILERLRGHSPNTESGEPGSADDSSPAADELPVHGYDKLDEKEVSARLSDLSQVELKVVEAYERSHQERPEVLDKLRYMCTTEPLPGYDALSIEQITEALAGADAETVKAVRDYERKFRHRVQVMDEAARALPAAPASAGEDRAREGRATLLRQGFEVRAKTAVGFSGGRTAPDGLERPDPPAADGPPLS